MNRVNNGCVKVGNSAANGCLTLVQQGGDAAKSGTYTFTVATSGQYAFQLDSYNGKDGSYSLGVSGSSATTSLCTVPFTTCPSNITANTTGCTATINYTAVHPGGSYLYKFTGATTGSGFGTGSGRSFNSGTTTVTITNPSYCGSVSTCTFTITVNDNVAPVIKNCPTNITQANDLGSCGANVYWTPPTRTDNCATTFTASHSPGAYFGIGTTTVTYTAKDASNNTTTCSFNVTVNDTEQPTITCLSNQTLSTNGGCTYTVASTELNPAYSDNCAGASALNNYTNSSSLAGAVLPKGTTTVVWTMTDAANNTRTCTYDITIIDTEKPTISCINDQTRSTNTGVCTYTVSGTEFNPTFSDNCPGSSVLNNYNNSSSLAGAVFPKGTTAVIWTATDASNNTKTCTLFVTVNDTQKPTITCPANITARPTSVSGATVSYTAPVGTDNCSGATTALTAGYASGATFAIGVTTVTYTVTDGSNNSTSCSFTVDVTDPYCSNHKVSVCHDGNTICVDVSALSAHLAHGDYMGKCDLSKRSDGDAYDHVDIYPNPTASKTTVFVNSNNEGHLNLRILSITGETLFTVEKDNFKGFAEIPLDLSAYATGMYFIHVAYSNKSEIFKIQRLN